MQDNTNNTATHPDYHARFTDLENQLEEFQREALLEIKEFRRKFDRRFHLLYTLIAFVGITLVWYAVWTIVSDIHHQQSLRCRCIGAGDLIVAGKILRSLGLSDLKNYRNFSN